MAYCLIEDAQITDGPRDLPKSWRNISGLNLLNDVALIAKGWLPYGDTKPEYDADTQYLTSVKVVSETTVEETYTVNDYTEGEMVTRIAAAQLARQDAIKADAQTIILASYPLWLQANVANGIYGSDVGDPMKAHIANIITESNRCEDLVDIAETLAEIRIIISAWPEV